MAEDQYLVLVFSPADKSFFDVRNIYQLQKEIHELKAKLAESRITVFVLNEKLLAAAILDLVKEKGPQTLGFAMSTDGPWQGALRSGDLLPRNLVELKAAANGDRKTEMAD